MDLLQSFTRHPASVGETYTEHMQTAGGFALALIVAGLACLVHAVFPFLCKTTGSQAIVRLHERMVVHRVKAAMGPKERSEADSTRQTA